jgi:molecular chaperone GrpE
MDEKRIADLTDERDRVRNQLLRTAADYDNFRKRSRKELQDAISKAREDVLREILPIIDNLERAQQSMTSASTMESIADGISMVLRGFQDTASRLDLKRLQTVGKPFDPNLHDAVQQIPSEEHAPGTVISEVVPGYQLGDRLLRPALVVVAKTGTVQRPETSSDGNNSPSSSNFPSDSESQDDLTDNDSQN